MHIFTPRCTLLAFQPMTGNFLAELIKISRFHMQSFIFQKVCLAVVQTSPSSMYKLFKVGLRATLIWSEVLCFINLNFPQICGKTSVSTLLYYSNSYTRLYVRVSLACVEGPHLKRQRMIGKNACRITRMFGHKTDKRRVFL
jgi:hypothetical protein